MRKVMNTVGARVNEMYLRGAIKAKNALSCRKAGVSELVVILLIVVVCVSLIALFKDKVADFTNDIFTKIDSEVTNNLLKDASAN